VKRYQFSDQIFDVPLGENRKEPVKNVIYLVRPKIRHMKWIANQVKHLTSKPQNQSVVIRVFLVPRKTLICEKILRELGVSGDIKLGEFGLYFIPLDYDLFTMELGSCYTECYLQGDFSTLFYVAKGLMKLQIQIGVIPHVKTAGPTANIVIDMMLRMRRQLGGDISVATPQVDTLVLLDRRLDLATALMTPLTYEGLIDEFIKINNSLIQPKFECVPGAKKDTFPKVLVNSSDTVYVELRDINISYAGAQLKKKSLQIEEEINEKNKLDTVEEMKRFRGKMPRLIEEKKSWETHLKIMQKINEKISKRDFVKFIECQQNNLHQQTAEDEQKTFDFLDSLIYRQCALSKVLRLLCHMSLLYNGIKSKMYDHYKRELVQSYGFEVLPTLYNLEKLSLLKRQESSSSFAGGLLSLGGIVGVGSGKNVWPTLRKQLDLLKTASEDNNQNNNSDGSGGGDGIGGMYDVYSPYAGYCPLTIRLVEQLQIAGGWKAIKSSLDLLPGPFRDFDQPNTLEAKKKVVLIFFIGGVTYGEIAALRYLNRRMTNAGVEYVIGTTHIINGNGFLEPNYDLGLGQLATRLKKPKKKFNLPSDEVKTTTTK